MSNQTPKKETKNEKRIFCHLWHCSDCYVDHLQLRVHLLFRDELAEGNPHRNPNMQHRNDSCCDSLLGRGDQGDE